MGKKNLARTQRGEATRARLLEVTLRLLAEADPRSVTLDQISDAAGVAKSSILWHFGSKEELILEALDGVIRSSQASRCTTSGSSSSPVAGPAEAFSTSGRFYRPGVLGSPTPGQGLSSPSGNGWAAALLRQIQAAWIRATRQAAA